MKPKTLAKSLILLTTLSLVTAGNSAFAADKI